MMNTVYKDLPVTLGSRTYPLASRKSKVSVADFAKPLNRILLSPDFFLTPNILAARICTQLLWRFSRLGAPAKQSFGNGRPRNQDGLAR